MNTDSQGRPLSEDGQWVWNGTEWVPTAAVAGGVAAGTASANRSNAAGAATMIAPTPVATPIPPAPQQGYGAPTYQPGPAPAGFGAGVNTPPFGANYPYVQPAPRKSRKLVIFGVMGAVLIIAGVAVALIFTLGGDKKKTASTKPVPGPTHGPTVPHDSPKPTDQPTPQPTDNPTPEPTTGPSDIPVTDGPVGAYTCSVSGSSETGVITFNNGAYTLSDNGKPGHYTVEGDTITFQGGSLNGADTTYDNTLDEVDIDYQGTTLTCTP